MAGSLIEFPSVVVGGAEIVVDQRRPVAAIVDASGAVRLAKWPDVDVGLVAPLATLVPAPDSAWVHYPPETVSLMDDSHADVLVGRDSPAVQVRPDGTTSAVRLSDRRAIGATTGALWSAPDREQPIDESYRGEPLPEGWEDPSLLTVVSSAGAERRIRVDRHVLGVFEEAGLIHIIVAPTPPIAVPSGEGFTFEYRISEITLPTTQPLPDRIRFLDHHPDGIGPTVAPRRCWWTAHDYGIPTAPTFDVDITDEPDTRWQPARLTDRQIADATAAAAQWFRDPDAFWHGEDGSVSPLAAGLRDAEVHIEDTWPRTRVVVTFSHPYWPEGRLRRSVRVFDEAGRLTSNPYVDLHLMEDLVTGHLPPTDRAHDGYLDI